MGRKRGRHITKVELVRSDLVQSMSLFWVHYTRSKCRYAKEELTLVVARDEMDAYIEFKKEQVS